MNHFLSKGQLVHGETTGSDYEAEEYIGGGAQGEVHRVTVNGTTLALKWYFPHYLKDDPELKERLQRLLSVGPPDPKFLWPIELASTENLSTFGYVMALREKRFKGILDMMRGRADPSFRALATAGFELADSYWQLHAKGLCYRDISFANVFFDPDSGEVQICDNDNVDIDGRPGPINGTPDFMAPEIVRGEANPSGQTDLFSLAVLLFYMFHIQHPLYGRRVMGIRCLDAPARRKLCGLEPLFIFDPRDRSNEAVPKSEDPLGEAGENALRYWPIYPKFLRDLFVQSFTDGLRDPHHGRVQETVWRTTLVRLRDSIIYCQTCGKENFYNVDRLREERSASPKCWSCTNEVNLPPRIRIGKHIVMLNHDTSLFAHHFDDRKQYDFSTPMASVTRHPKDPTIWGLKNLSEERWVIPTKDGSAKEVEPGQSVQLTRGLRIQFGSAEGEIRT